MSRQPALMSANAASPHVIETLQLDCRFPSKQLALQQQERLSQFFKGPGLAAIAAQFDRISPAGEVWCIDSLEVDLGRLDPQSSPDRWSAQLSEQLWAALQHKRHQDGLPQQAGEHNNRPGSALLSPSDSDLAQFMHYVQHGHLPWSANPSANRDMAEWLQHLALHHGPRLWQRLQAAQTSAPPSAQILQRLCHISPHSGLQALIAVRHAELADSLTLLDSELLAPLHASGRISAYQLRQLQQQYRVAALHTLWGLSGSSLSAAAQHGLLQALSQAHIEQLGAKRDAAWLSNVAKSDRVTQQPNKLARLLMLTLLGANEDFGPAHAHEDAPPLAPPAARADLVQLHTLLCSEALINSAQLSAVLARLSAQQGPHESWLAQHLRAYAIKKRHRLAWAQQLAAPQLQQLMQLMEGPAPARHAQPEGPSAAQADEANAAPAALPMSVAWTESLRQFALRMQASAPAHARLGVSQLQQQLMAFSLGYLEQHGALPQDHVAWQAVWERGLQAKQPAAPASAKAAPHTPTTKPAEAAAQASATSASALRAHVFEYSLQQAALGRRAQSTSWPVQQAALKAPFDWSAFKAQQPAHTIGTHTAELPTSEQLQTDEACAQWVATHDESQRWALIRTHFPHSAPLIRSCHAALLMACQLQCPELTLPQVQNLHWQLLVQHLFVDALPAEPGLLARRYALKLCQRDLTLHGPQASSWQRWLHRMGTTFAQLWNRKKRDLTATTTTTPSQTQRLRLQAMLAMQAALRMPPQLSEQWEACLSAGPLPSGHQFDTPTATPVDPRAPGRRPPPRIAPAAVAPRDGQPIYVVNAGVVLLCSYVQRLFAALKLTDQAKFVDDAAAARALHCFEYMAWGHNNGNEPAWVLSKLLCGIPLAQPVPPCAGLDDPTRELMDGLLGAAIGHWKAIGNTSVAGLRESFLQRAGRLTPKESDLDGQWQLTVEPRSFDMLLDRLPWSFSTIKLPWMKGALYVDWR